MIDLKVSAFAYGTVGSAFIQYLGAYCVFQAANLGVVSLKEVEIQ